jgi:hypothetical protein
MFSLNPNGIFVLTMSKKSYFPEWDSPLQTVYTDVPLSTQYPLKKHMLLRHRLLRLQITYRTVMNKTINFSKSTLTFVICRLLAT